MSDWNRLGPTAHVDNFARRCLPPFEDWPDLTPRIPGIEVPTYLNAATELLDRTVERGQGGRTALIAPGMRWTYADLQDKANRIAQVLIEDRGVAPGHRVLLRGFNHPMLVACLFGVWKAGAVAVPTMPLLRSRELIGIVERAQVNVALCDAALSAEMEQARPGRASMHALVYYNRSDRDGLEAAMARKSGEFSNYATGATDVALIAFTSGTTGGPKAAMHFHRDIVVGSDLFPQCFLKPAPDDIFCGSPPVAFTFGLGGLVMFPFRVGAASLLLEKAPPEALLQGIQDYRATICFTAPTAYRAMAGMVGRFDVKSLRKCVSAGEPLPVPTYEAWHKATGLRMVDGIGSTELLHIFISGTDDDFRPGAIGKVVPGYEARVVDDAMRPVAPGTVGRLAVRGPTGCRYLADERQRNYVRQGWNLTGDSFKMDADGYFYFQARTDDIIVSAGYNISGPEVEAALLEHPAVAECGVVAAPDPERGNVVMAFVVLRPERPGDSGFAKELQDFVKDRIAPYKYPRRIRFLEAMPRTGSGKLQRFRLREMAKEG
jgi:2-aminobenzoate-CoA ligase